MAEETTAPTGTTPTPDAGGPKPEVKPEVKPEPKADPKKAEEPKKVPQEDDLLTGDAKDETPADDKSGEVEITVPEGVEVNKELLDGFKAIAKDLKLDSKAAQKVVDFYIAKQTAAIEQDASNWDRQRQEWREQAAKDKEIGGAKFKENVDLARRVIKQFGGEGLMTALRDLGLGSHPEIVKFAYRVGKAISEDSLTEARPSAPASDSKEAALRAAFPSMYEDSKK